MCISRKWSDSHGLTQDSLERFGRFNNNLTMVFIAFIIISKLCGYFSIYLFSFIIE